jgi:YesN/AraC family two-component response regulator
VHCVDPGMPEKIIKNLKKNGKYEFELDAKRKDGSTKALELFKSNPYQFDLVITDMTMPGLLGTQLAKKLLEIRPDLPF